MQFALSSVLLFVSSSSGSSQLDYEALFLHCHNFKVRSKTLLLLLDVKEYLGLPEPQETMTHPSVSALDSQPHKRSANGIVTPFAPPLPAEVVGKILSLTGEHSTFIARVAVLGRAWHDAVEYLDHLGE